MQKKLEHSRANLSLKYRSMEARLIRIRQLLDEDYIFKTETARELSLMGERVLDRFWCYYHYYIAEFKEKYPARCKANVAKNLAMRYESVRQKINENDAKFIKENLYYMEQLLTSPYHKFYDVGVVSDDQFNTEVDKCIDRNRALVKEYKETEEKEFDELYMQYVAMDLKNLGE